MQVKIKIRDYEIIRNITKLSSSSPTPPLPVNITPSLYTPPLSTYRIVTIISDGSRLPDANEGDIININVISYCKTGDIITYPQDRAILIVDGAYSDEKTLIDGAATFEWTAYSTPNIHNVCVRVSPTNSCSGYGQDCKRIYVSSANPFLPYIPSQTTNERLAEQEQLQILKQQRDYLRNLIIAPISLISSISPPPTPIPYSPNITPIPTTTYTPSTPPPPVIDTETGKLKIIALPLNINLSDTIKLYVDGKLFDRIYNVPKTITLDSGTHDIYIKAGSYQSTPISVNITPDTTTSISFL